ncbi:MAG: hypothetical protein EOL97_09820 [Spirochaetia bacterium]|nr:hypothetical protein [Spirochaetia bacterium]
MGFVNTTENSKYPYKYPVKKLEIKPTKTGGEYARFYTTAKEKYTDKTGKEVTKYTEGEVWVFGKVEGLEEGKMFSFKFFENDKFDFSPNSYISKVGQNAGKVCQVQLMKFYNPSSISVYDNQFAKEKPKEVEVVDAPVLEPIDSEDGLPF